ncbi:MAG: hypothetical protein GY705_23020 [Bacteroidetes bacterium]|nr:hypothetical protein [Bacteroidota bacterium]
MILAEDRSKRKAQKGFRYFFIAIVALAALFVILKNVSFQSSSSIPGLIHCDAEKVKKNDFKTNEHLFKKGETQSADRAHSGQYSSKLEIGTDLQYGFSYKMEKPIAGTYFIASVWRYMDEGSTGFLVVQSNEEAGIYLRQELPKLKGSDGWDLIEIPFVVPFKKELEWLNFYVYSDGRSEVYFDDLKIEKVSQLTESDFQLPVLELTIGEKALNKLQQKRQEAIKLGILESDDKDWVNARLIAEEHPEPVRAEVRLKGDLPDHLKKGKWSFRVKVKSPNTWNRMRTFSLHTPASRLYLSEWILHRLWGKEDVLTPRYDFVELHLNGESQGVYAYEEHFEKHLIEHKGRREGPILKFSEEGFWGGLRQQYRQIGYRPHGLQHSVRELETAKIEPFAEKTTRKSANLSRQVELAQNLIFQYKNNLKPAAEVFDLDLMARYYAIIDALGAYHGIAWHNQRFYYNPVTALLEPVGFDGFGEVPRNRNTFLGQAALNPGKLVSGNVFANLFLDKSFTEKYIYYLCGITSRQYLQTFFNELEPEIQARYFLLKAEFDQYQYNSTDLLSEAQHIQTLLFPHADLSLKIYTKQSKDDQKVLSLTNAHTLPIEVFAFGSRPGNFSDSLETSLLFAGFTSRELWTKMSEKSTGMPSNFEAIRKIHEQALFFQQTKQFQEINVPFNAQYLFFRVPGIDSVFSSKISPWPPPENAHPRQTIINDTLPHSNQFMKVSERQVVFQKGVHPIQKDILIPDGCQVFFEAGCELDFEKGTKFISHAPVFMYGTEEEPIIIRSSDKSAGGFSVFQTNENSVLHNVIFEGFNTLNEQGWMLTGAVTFYEADVSINNCSFRNSVCEDALNIIRSDFTLQNSYFSDTRFDALDVDFSKGEITNCRFTNAGNDGGDFSGSVVNLKNCFFQNCGDKGVSVGEESDVTILSATIREAPIALACKDLSTLLIHQVALENCDQGFTAYQKKPDYGGSKMIVQSFSQNNVKRLYAISEGSSLQLEGKMILGE